MKLFICAGVGIILMLLLQLFGLIAIMVTDLDVPLSFGNALAAGIIYSGLISNLYVVFKLGGWLEGLLK